MKKIFILAGELSGDRLAAWYVQSHLSADVKQIQAIGGDYLKDAGVHLYQRFETLNVTGIVEIIKHIPSLLKKMHQLRDYILTGQFDHVILVDFPGFNLRLLKLLAQKNPNLKITYLSPPQLWCWGAWRLKPIKKYVSNIIVLYPFEVEWYQQRGVKAVWLGNPVYDAIKPHMTTAQRNKKPLIALLPGSRRGEIVMLLPLFLKAARILKHKHPEVSFVLPLARSLNQALLDDVVVRHGLQDIWHDVTLIPDNDDKYKVLKQCCGALTKPGTVTLELALLKIPTVVAYKTSWLTYGIARLLVNVSSMTLPNLILKKRVFKEIIQFKCSPATIASQLDELYCGWLKADQANLDNVKMYEELEQMLNSKSL